MSAFEDIVMKGNRAPYIENDDKKEPGFINAAAHNFLGGLEGMGGDLLKGIGAQLNALDEAGRESSYVESIRDSDHGTLGLLGDGFVNNGAYLSNQAEDIAKQYGTREEYSNLGFMDRLMNADYLTDTRGLASDVFTGLGSSVPFVTGSLVAPEITLPGRALQAMRAIPYAGRLSTALLDRGAGSALNQMAGSAALTTPLDAFTNASGIYDELKKQGLSDTEIAAKIREAAVEEAPYDFLSSAILGGTVSGKLGKAIAGKNGGLSRNLLGGASTIPIEMASEYLQESMQQRMNNKYTGKPYGDLLHPTEDESAAGATAAFGALIPAAGGAAHTAYRGYREGMPSGEISTDDNNINGFDGNLIEKWESKPGATDLQNVQPSVKAAFNGLAAEYGGGITLTGGAEKGYHEEGEFGHEGGWKLDVDKKSIRDPEKFFQLCSKYGFAVGDEGDHYDLSAHSEGGTGGRLMARPEQYVNQGGSGPSSAGQREGHENAWAIYDVFHNAGYSDNAIAGILGRVQQEHNFETSNVEEYDDENGRHLGGYGMFQWNGGRTQAFLNWAQENNLDPQSATVQAQYALLEAEQRGLTPEKMNGLSHEDAATLWTDKWEVGDPGEERKYAGEWLERIGKGGKAGGAARESSSARQTQDVPALEDDTSLYEGFAREQLEASRNAEDVDFFHAFFKDNGNFKNTEENLAKIRDRVQGDLAEEYEDYVSRQRAKQETGGQQRQGKSVPEAPRIETKANSLEAVRQKLAAHQEAAIAQGDLNAYNAIASTLRSGDTARMKQLADTLPELQPVNPAQATPEPVAPMQTEGTSTGQAATTPRTAEVQNAVPEATQERVPERQEVQPAQSVIPAQSSAAASQRNVVPQQAMPQPIQGQAQSAQNQGVNMRDAYETGMGPMAETVEGRQRQGKGLLLVARTAGIQLPSGLPGELRNGSRNAIPKAQQILRDAGVSLVLGNSIPLSRDALNRAIGGMTNESTETAESTETKAEERAAGTKNQDSNAESEQAEEKGEVDGKTTPQNRAGEEKAEGRKETHSEEKKDSQNEAQGESGENADSITRSRVESRLRSLKRKRKKDIADEVDRMNRNPGGRGTDRGYTYDDNGNINGRWAVSNNPEWYQRAYKKYGRKPKKSEYEDIAEDTLKDIQEFRERDDEIARLESILRGMKENEGQEKSNNKYGSFSISKDGKQFTAGIDRTLNAEGMENIATLAESFGGTSKDGKYSFKTKKDRADFLNLANAYIRLIDETGSSQYSVSSDMTHLRDAIRSMKIVKTDALTNQLTMLSTMGETMGCPVVWMDTVPSLNGVHCGNVTFLNRNAGMDIQKTFWHEQFHWIKNNNQKLYKQLLSYFKGKSAFTKKQIDKYRNDTARHSLSDKDVIEEILADEFMSITNRVPMLQQMAKEKPTLAKRFVAWIKHLMDRVSEWFHNPDGKFTTAQRDTFVNAFGELAGSMKDSNGKPLFKTYNKGKQITLSNGDSLLSQLLDMVENPLSDITGLKLSAAWHGSPHAFDKFSLDKIGTGEGAQVHGYGLYFAKEREVSEGYRENLSDGKWVVTIGDNEYHEEHIDGKTHVVDKNGDKTLPGFELAIRVFAKTGDIQTALDMVERNSKRLYDFAERLKTLPWRTEKDVQNNLDKADSYDVAHDILELEGNDWTVYKPGSLLQVEIPDEDVMLDEQKRFEEQPETVQKALKRFLKEYANRYHYKKEGDGYAVYDGDRKVNVYDWEEDAQTSVEENNEAIQDSIDSAFRGGIENLTGREIYGGMIRLMHGDKKASEKLNDIGIKGITYEGGRDGRCYVVFDDEAVEITAKFSADLSQGNEQEESPIDNSENIGDNGYKVSRSYNDIPYQTQEFTRNVLKNKGIAHRITSNDDVDSICDKVISPLKDSVETLLDRYVTGTSDPYRQRMIDTAALYIGMIDELRRDFNAGGPVYDIISESSLVRGRAGEGSPLAKSLETRRRQIEEAKRTGKRIGVKTAGAVDGFSKKHQPIVDAIRAQDRGDGIKFSANLNNNNSKHSGKSASSMPEMKAPKGKDTNLTEEQWNAVRTEPFKMWFGDWENDKENASKVVDENGEPLVVYHGTQNGGFYVFDPSKSGYEDAQTNASFFSDNKRMVEDSYYYDSEDGTGEKQVYAVFLNMKNPLVMNARGERWNALTPPKGMEGRKTDTNKVAEWAKENGYDGVVFKQIFDGNVNKAMMSDVYAIFNSNQVKSATENVGTYDNENPDIRFSANLNGERKHSDNQGAFSSAKHFSIDGKPIVGVRKYSAAWHGSPHKFDTFSLEAIGTGEGVQMRGYGLYFSKDPSIATRYRDVLSKTREWDADAGEWKIKHGKGNLYQVSIPDEDVLLDYMVPISKQSKKVQDALRDIAKGKEELEQAIKDDATGYDFYNQLSDILGNAPSGMGLGNDKAASELLNSHGVKGVVYDEGYQRGGDGLCYVVFDDKALKIIQRMESPGDTTEGRSIAELKAEVTEAFPNAKVQEQGDTLVMTMPNGQKVTVTLHESITASDAELGRAKEAHGIPQNATVTIEGYAETVGEEGFVALSQGSREGTGFHEAYHIAEAMAFSKYELDAAKRLISENEEERADTYARWRKSRQRFGNFAKLWNKIADVAAKMAGLLGFETKRNLFRKVASGEIYERNNGNGGDAARQYSVAPSDNSRESLFHKIGNLLSGTKPTEYRHRKMMADLLGDALQISIRGGKIADSKGAVIYKENDRVIRSKHMYDWENILPVAGGVIAEQLGIVKKASQTTEAMKNYIAGWIMTGNPNNTSPEAKEFQRGMQRNPFLADKLQKVRYAFEKWNNMSAREQMQASIQMTKQTRTNWKEVKEYAYDQLIEELGPVERLVQEIQGEMKKAGHTLSHAVNPMVAFRLARGSHGRAITMIEGRGKAAVEALKKNFPNVDFTGFKTLHDILKDIGAFQNIEKQRDFITYCTACHVLNMHQKNTDIRLEQQHLRNKAAKAQDEKEKKELEKQAEALEKEIMPIPDAFSEENCKEYIRTGEKEYGKAQKELVHFSNTSAAILADSGVISQKRYRELLTSWPNYVPMFRVFEENEDIDFGDSLKHIKGSLRDLVNPLESIIRNTTEFVKKAEYNKARCLLANLARCDGSGMLLEEVDNSKPNDKTTITFYEDGTRKYLQTDPSVVQAVNSMNRDSSNAVLHVLHLITSVARACFTIASPEFAMRNVFRDYADAFVYNKNGFISPPDMFRAFMHAVKRDETYYEWLSSGAAMASAISLDRNYTQEIVDKLGRSWGKRLTSKQFFPALLEGLQKAGEYSEYATRIAMYEKAKEHLTKGEMKAEAYEAMVGAAFESRDLMDFARHGKAAAFWNKLVPFANASLQGMNKFYRTVLDPNGWRERPKEMTRAFARLMLSSAIPAFLLCLLYRDEDWYKNAPDWLKETHWLIPVGDTLLRIPKGSDVGVRYISNLVEKGMSDKHYTIKQYNMPLWDALPDLLPVATKPMIEAYLNKSFFTGRNIVPQYQEKLPEKMQYGPYTTGMAKVVGEQLGIAPSKIDHVLSGHVGSVGMVPWKVIDILAGDRQLDTALEEMPLTRAITYMPYKNPQSVQDFYKKLDEQTKLENEYKLTGKKPEGYDPAFLNRLKAAKKQLSPLSKQERSVIDNKNYDLEQRKKLQKQIQQKRIQIVTRALGK